MMKAFWHQISTGHAIACYAEKQPTKLFSSVKIVCSACGRVFKDRLATGQKHE